MPSYDYRCKECNREFTVRRSVNDDLTPNCPTCESINVNRIWSEVHVKKSGFGPAHGGCGGGCSRSCSR